MGMLWGLGISPEDGNRRGKGKPGVGRDEVQELGEVVKARDCITITVYLF